MTTSTMGKRWMLAVVAAAAIAVWPVWLSTKTTTPAGSEAGDAANLDFTLKDMNGADVHLADFRGRPVILNFWATWCGPCKAEIPALVALAERYKSRHLTVLGVSVDDTPEDLRQFAAHLCEGFVPEQTTGGEVRDFLASLHGRRCPSTMGL